MRSDTAKRPDVFRAVLALTVATLAAQIVYVYLVRFRQFVHSDTAALVLLGKSAIDAHAVIPTRWYWGNGDVWLFGAPIAAGPVALLGVGIETLRVTSVLVFVLELGVFTYCYRLLTKSTLVSVLAAAVTLLGISRLHLLFVYVELGYGFITMEFFAIFVLLAEAARTRSRRRWIVALALVFLVAASNPTRFLMYGLAPIFLAVAWPWRGLALRDRATMAAIVTGTWGVAWATYRFAFPRLVTFSPEAGHDRFAIKDLAGIAENAALYGRGLIALSGESGGLRLAALPGLVFVFGAIALVVVYVLEHRVASPLGFVAVAQLGQFGALSVPMLLGNLMLNPLSGRYLLPAVLPMLGMSVVLARDALLADGMRRALARAWLVLAPALGLLALGRMIGASLEAANAQWSNRAGHLAVANELIARNLRHGFASYWNASLVTLLSEGRARTCPATVGDEGIFPYKWGVDSGCFDRANIGDRVYFVAAAEQRESFTRATTKAFGPAAERFEAGGFEVMIFESSHLDWEWLDLPLPAGDAIRFPLVLPASHPAIRHGNVVREGRTLVATGTNGNVVFGPYVDLPAGDYRIRWLGAGIDSPGDVAFDAYAGDAGHLGDFRIAAKDLVGRDELASLSFTLPRPTRAVELRVHSGEGGRVVLRELRIERR
jgi:hypothetical protein